MDPSLDKALLLIEGKGGVGKSTVCAALGLHLARAGRRVLILELTPQAHVAQMFGHDGGDAAPQELAPGLFHQALRPEACLEEYALLKLHFRALYRLIFLNPVVRALMRMVPAMDELLLIGKVEHAVREGGYDHVIVDAPVTGEGILLFLLPRVITEAVHGGPLFEDAQRIRALLEDPRRTAMHLVTLAEDLPVNETIELHHEIQGRVGLPLGKVFVNRLYPRALGSASKRLLQTALASGVSCLEGTPRLLRFLEARRANQERYLNRLERELPLPRVELPEVLDASDEVQVLEALVPHLP